MNPIHHIRNGIIHENSHSANLPVRVRAIHRLANISWRLRIENESHHVTYFGLFYFVDHNSAFQTCVCYDVEQRSLECFLYDSCTDLLVAVQAVNQLCKLCCYMNVCRTAACDDTLFYGCSRCI